MKSDAGFAKVAGIELTLLDCARYFHKGGGINGVAQIAKDIGAKADPRTLAKIAAAYEKTRPCAGSVICSSMQAMRDKPTRWSPSSAAW